MGGERALRCLAPGMSIVVGSIDDNGRPCCCRAHGIRSTDDLSTLTVYVPVVTSRQTITNVALTRRMAVVATYPPDHFSVQLKGTVIGARMARDDERAIVDSGRDSFADSLELLGVPRRVLRNVVNWPAFAIEMRVEDVFEQTPGPRAGSRVQ